MKRNLFNIDKNLDSVLPKEIQVKPNLTERGKPKYRGNIDRTAEMDKILRRIREEDAQKQKEIDERKAAEASKKENNNEEQSG